MTTNFQSVGASELLTGCLCHGYLDVYASLWTTWKLVCGEGESSSNLPRDGQRLKVKTEATFIFKGNKFNTIDLY